MEKQEIEKLIEDRVLKGLMGEWLYGTELAFVLVEINGDSVSFKWADHIENIEDYI